MTASNAGDPAEDPDDARPDATGPGILDPDTADRLWGWVGPLVVTAFAAILRFSRLSVPHAVNYDETDYIKDAWSILQHGVEWNPIANPAGYPPGQSYADNLLLSGARTSLRPALATAVARP